MRRSPRCSCTASSNRCYRARPAVIIWQRLTRTATQELPRCIASSFNFPPSQRSGCADLSCARTAQSHVLEARSYVRRSDAAHFRGLPSKNLPASSSRACNEQQHVEHHGAADDGRDIPVPLLPNWLLGSRRTIFLGEQRRRAVEHLFRKHPQLLCVEREVSEIVRHQSAYGSSLRCISLAF